MSAKSSTRHSDDMEAILLASRLIQIRSCPLRASPHIVMFELEQAHEKASDVEQDQAQDIK